MALQYLLEQIRVQPQHAFTCLKLISFFSMLLHRLMAQPQQITFTCNTLTNQPPTLRGSTLPEAAGALVAARASPGQPDSNGRRTHNQSKRQPLVISSWLAPVKKQGLNRLDLPLVCVPSSHKVLCPLHDSLLPPVIKALKCSLHRKNLPTRSNKSNKWCESVRQRAHCDCKLEKSEMKLRKHLHLECFLSRCYQGAKSLQANVLLP